MTSAQAPLGLTDRVVGGARRLAGVFVYLWVVLTLFALHESIVLAKHEIDYRGYGMALINAWVLAKVMLVADDLNLGSRWFENRRLIYRIVSRSALFALVFMAAHTVEDLVVGWWQGKTVLESIPRLGRGSFAEILSIGVILSVALTPFFAFRALEQALGAGVVLRLLLAPRSKLEPRDVSRT
jgi:hypothetical protein